MWEVGVLGDSPSRCQAKAVLLISMETKDFAFERVSSMPCPILVQQHRSMPEALTRVPRLEVRPGMRVLKDLIDHGNDLPFRVAELRPGLRVLKALHERPSSRCDFLCFPVRLFNSGIEGLPARKATKGFDFGHSS